MCYFISYLTSLPIVGLKNSFIFLFQYNTLVFLRSLASLRDDKVRSLKNYPSTTCCGHMRFIQRRVRDSTRTAAINETLVTENSRAAAFIPTNDFVIPKRSEGSKQKTIIAPQKKK